ncbi:polysaccharide pyruvyl transferase family protein [Rhodobacter sp. CZR27]|uniref:polysaccharide pyruvyl transferase family protein n=1 Tax=Rhodobacter sp. CZR27 TaxID=2033869 RepID=UPI000BBEE3F4|nr:polysaccharide pyruvyl transferase family protein [Rhodobacter sp. CZR27]
MKLLVVNDTDGRRNPGCRLTSRTLKQSLEATFPEAEVTPAPWGFGRRLRLPRWSDRLVAARGGDVFGRSFLRTLSIAEYGLAAVAAVEEGAAVVFQPEGTISDSHRPLRILRNLSLPLYAVLHVGVPVAVTNGTFPLFRDERAEPIRMLLKGAVHASLRDRPSAEFWQVGFAPDTAVLWEGEPVVADADCLLITTGAEVAPERDLAAARSGLALCRETGLRPLVMTKAWERLVPMRAEVEALGGVFMQDVRMADADVLLSRCRAHVGGRYHMALMCATKGIPSALVRTNTHKNLWLAEEFRGIRLADSEEALGQVGRELLAGELPSLPLLQDVRRCCDLQAARMADLRSAVLAGQGTPTRPTAPSAALLSAIASESRRDLWKGTLRRITGRKI